MLRFLSSTKGQGSSFKFAHWLFGRCLGVVSLIAFLSYWSQADALIGQNGLNPWTNELERIESFIEVNEEKPSKFILRPTLLWFPLFDNHNLIFILGSISSLALALGFMPGPSAILSWLFYLSLSVVGEPFLSFQWDALLLETLFLSIPFLPFVSKHYLSKPILPSRWARILILLLLAKLMIESGVVKFTYFDSDGSNTWIDYTALDFHYWTQPLPHSLSPLIHSLPAWFDWFSLNTMYFIEIVLPLFFFLPRNWRRFALAGQIILQLAILLSGNYGFFNLLTLTLCIPLLDDALIPSRFRPIPISEKKENKTIGNGFYLSHLTTLYFIFLSTAWIYLKSDLMGNRSGPEHKAEENWIKEIRNLVQPLRSFNSYGLFRVMTKTRPEIIIEGSMNGDDWKIFDFKWKPDHVDDIPSFTGPHMPRIDWQMWFEGLRAERYVSQPFSRFLYGRFLNIIANGGGQKECFDFNYVLGEQEIQALAQAPPQQRQIIFQNFQNWMNVFFRQSKWFGEFLQACFEKNLVILEELENVPFINNPPQHLRISILHYQFGSSSKDDNQSFWKTKSIPNGEIQIYKK